MAIIIFAAPETEQALEALQDQFDSAKSDDQREQIATNVYSIVGDKLRSMISYAAKGHKLEEDQLDAFAWQSLYRGLDESGMPRFKRDSAADADWQPQIQHMVAAARTNEPSPAARIWNLLSDKTKSAIAVNPEYIKSTVQNLFLADLNAMLRRRDLYTPLLWHRDSLPLEARNLFSQGIESMPASRLAQFNSILIASAFSEIAIPIPPKRNLLGYIATTVVPQLKPAIWESATGKTTNLTLVEAWSALKDDIAAVQQAHKSGTTPDEWQSLTFAEQVVQHHRQRLNARFGPVLSWWNERMRELLPQSNFAIRDAASLREAREYLEQHRDRVSENVWKFKDSQYYLPMSAVQPYGVRTVERLLVTEGFGQQGSPALRPLYTQPSPQATGDSEAMQLLSGGHQSPAFKWFVDRYFSAPGLEAEHAVGVFLASAPTPSNQQIQKFLDSLPDEMAERIESIGFRNLTRQIDERILSEIKKPEVRNEFESALGQPRSVANAILDIRRNIFVRTSELILARAG